MSTRRLQQLTLAKLVLGVLVAIAFGCTPKTAGRHKASDVDLAKLQLHQQVVLAQIDHYGAQLTLYDTLLETLPDVLPDGTNRQSWRATINKVRLNLADLRVRLTEVDTGNGSGFNLDDSVASSEAAIDGITSELDKLVAEVLKPLETFLTSNQPNQDSAATAELRIVYTGTDGKTLEPATARTLKPGDSIKLSAALYQGDSYRGKVSALWYLKDATVPDSNLIANAPATDALFRPSQDGSVQITATIVDASIQVSSSTTETPVITVAGFADRSSPPLAATAGLPPDPSNATTLDLEVTGADGYKYKLIQGTATCAADANPYSTDWLDPAVPVSVDLGADGAKRLCLIGKRGAVVQAEPTTYAWTKDTVAPSAFFITSPASYTNLAAPVLTWSASPGATHYDTVVASDSGCNTAVQTRLGAVDTTYTLASLSSQPYFVCVTAYDDAGNRTAASNTFYPLSVDQLAPPAPTAPTAPAYVTTPTVALSWTAVSDNGPAGIGRYHLKVGTTPGGSDAFDQDVGLVTSFSVSPADGHTYYASVRAIDKAGNASAYSAASTPFVVDLTNPTPPPVLVTAATSGGSDSRYSPTTQAFLSWSGDSDAGSGIDTYTLYSYDQANCAGTETVTAGLTSRSSSLTGAPGGSYSFKVKVLDKAGRSATTACSGPIKLQTVPPVALIALSAVTGVKTGEIKVSVDFPAAPPYQQVDIRRIAGIAAPSDLCNNGTVVKSYTTFTDASFWDDTGDTAGGLYSYRACILGTNGETTATDKVESVAARLIKHSIFVTSQTYQPGNLAGLAGADGICTNLATNAGLTGPNWRAILSAGSVSAHNRLFINGPIYNRNNQLVAAGRTALWSGTLTNPVSTDESGGAVAAGTLVLSSSFANGSPMSSDCAGWTSTAGGQVGGAYANNASSYWIWIDQYRNNCGVAVPFLCLSQQTSPPGLTSFTAAAGTNPGEVTVSMTVPADTSHYGRIDLRRAPSDTVVGDDCTTGTVIKQYQRDAITDDSFTDATGITDGYVNYRACVYDLDGNMVWSSPATNVKPQGSVAERVFVTSSVHNGNFGGVTGADGLCQSSATGAGLAGTWKALLAASSPATSVFGRLSINGPMYNLRSTGYQRIAASVAAFSTALSVPIQYDEFGNLESVYVWTGATTTDGSISTWNCNSWSDATTGYLGTFGSSVSTTGGAFNVNPVACSNTYHLYCIEQ